MANVPPPFGLPGLMPAGFDARTLALAQQLQLQQQQQQAQQMGGGLGMMGMPQMHGLTQQTCM